MQSDINRNSGGSPSQGMVNGQAYISAFKEYDFKILMLISSKNQSAASKFVRFCTFMLIEVFQYGRG